MQQIWRNLPVRSVEIKMATISARIFLRMPCIDSLMCKIKISLKVHPNRSNRRSRLRVDLPHDSTFRRLWVSTSLPLSSTLSWVYHRIPHLEFNNSSTIRRRFNKVLKMWLTLEHPSLFRSMPSCSLKSKTQSSTTDPWMPKSKAIASFNSHLSDCKSST